MGRWCQLLLSHPHEASRTERNRKVWRIETSSFHKFEPYSADFGNFLNLKPPSLLSLDTFRSVAPRSIAISRAGHHDGALIASDSGRIVDALDHHHKPYRTVTFLSVLLRFSQCFLRNRTAVRKINCSNEERCYNNYTQPHSIAQSSGGPAYMVQVGLCVT
jgi:hypothetical protein